MSKVTISLIKADVGSVPGHHIAHPKQLNYAEERLQKAKEEGIIIDFFVFNCGDDIELSMTYSKGENDSSIHELAWNT